MLKDLILKSYKAIKALVTRRILIECDSIPYEFQNVPLKKILNWIFVETSILSKPVKPWGWPTHLQIEPTAYCNLKCVICPVTEGLNRPAGHMDFNLYKKVIDEIGAYVFLILFWDWGEPFLNPSIYEMISYAKQKDIKVVTSTNGHLFTHIKHVDKVIRSGLDTLIVAVDGISQETYVRYRQGGKLESVLEGIKAIVARKHELNSKTPFINLRFIIMKHNEHEIPKLNDFANSLKVDALTFRTLNPFGNNNSHPNKIDGNKLLPENPAYKRFIYDPKDHSRIQLKYNPCKRLWNNPVIHWDGKVCQCTFDTHGRYVLEDLTKENFKDIWSGISYRELRHQFLKDYKKLKLCSECKYAFKSSSCNTDFIIESTFFTR